MKRKLKETTGNFLHKCVHCCRFSFSATKRKVFFTIYDNPLRFEISDCGVISMRLQNQEDLFVELNIFKTFCVLYSLNAAGDELKNTVGFF